LFLLAFLDWKQGDSQGARELLRRAAETGEEWRPEGAAAEGDVRRTMHRETTLFAASYASWDRSTDPEAVFDSLQRSLLDYRRF
jgi:hypothetical protein